MSGFGMDGAALDRYITGNYGEDQFRGCDECEDCARIIERPNEATDTCPYDFDIAACDADREADEADRANQMEADDAV